MQKNKDYDIREIDVDPRFVIAKKEMLITFAVQLCYTFLMLIVAYTVGKGDPKNYSFIMGMPAWWFYALIITGVFLILIYFIVTKVFVPISVEPWVKENQERGE